MSSENLALGHIRELEIKKIRLDGGTQSRIGLNHCVVEEYRSRMKEGISFPPVQVWFDNENYWLADGFHRVEAARTSGITHIAARIQSGTLEDAVWDSLGANAVHGLRRSRADIGLIVTRALKHKRSTGISVNQLSKHLGIPEPTLRRWIKKADSPGRLVRAAETAEADRTLPPLRDGHRLLKDLELLRQGTNRSETVALVNIIDKWFVGVLGPAAVAAAFDRLFQRRQS